MTKNPLINALIAALYICAVVGVPQLAQRYLHDTPDTFLIPIALLSLFVLSAAVMAGLFFYQPLTMFLEGQKKEGIVLAFKTVAAFALITLILLAGLFLPAVYL